MFNWIFNRKKSATAKSLENKKRLSKWEMDVTSCQTCGHGREHWRTNLDGALRCMVCGGNPLIEGDGRDDWRDWQRVKMVVMFGPRLDGDLDLIDKYREELIQRGYM